MTPMTRNVLSEGSRRAFGNCFGPPIEMVELPAETESQRLFACAVVFADDLRFLPEYGLTHASAEERFLAAWGLVRILRDVEAGRIGHDH